MKKEVSVKTLDRLCSQVVRRRAMQRVGGCERCLKKKISYQNLDWAHLLSRNKHSVRWDLDNGVGLCGGCHIYLDTHSKEKEAFKLEILGEERLAMLEARERDMSKVDREAVRLYLREELKKYET